MLTSAAPSMPNFLPKGNYHLSCAKNLPIFYQGFQSTVKAQNEKTRKISPPKQIRVPPISISYHEMSAIRHTTKQTTH